MIFNFYIPDLRHFYKAAIRLRRKTKTITADDGTAMDSNMIANNTIMIDFYTGMNNAVIADGNIIPDIGVGIYFSVVTNFHIFSQVGKSSDKYIITVRSCFGNINGLLNTSKLLLHNLLVFAQ